MGQTPPVTNNRYRKHHLKHIRNIYHWRLQQSTHGQHGYYKRQVVAVPVTVTEAVIVIESHH